ncbi:fumarylacetoacetate hydrolase family protein [Cryobacterium psychrophilum]|uniref:FAA hydrolase family protein n=1 Tax=Cryobacterium psychrophilum TaxID=41988 RepID=A0A4Y8KLQ5_9MICO|nr:fumarylacetoacetate hydrolase family protein [Cryobacterium psychrophilum]TDW30105.1 fumarylpyruvate hydrolase [Cryobacterium psychrophilum]TFD75974.1 FAA hydrolase family protein [Cryobacterium psychrophilum]
MSSALSAPLPASLPVAGSDDRFFVRRVYCVGRNYADHAREMGNDPDREPPFFFAKPADAVFAVHEGVPARQVAPNEVPYPPETENLHFEMELVVAIGEGGSSIEPADALAHVWGYGAGIDLTRRDLQNSAKSLRRPWDLAKGFDFSGPCTPLVPASVIGHPVSARIWLSVDGQPKQVGDLVDQIWPVPDIVAALSRSVTLLPGDVIFTGTPAGVGAIVTGNVVAGGIDGIGELSFRVV